MAAALDAGADLATARIALAENPDILDTCGHRLYPDGLNLCRGRGEPAAGCFEEGDEVLLFSGAAVMFSRAAWEKAGGFDEGFFGYGEDAELGLRAARLGLRCRYVPDARVRHRVGGAFGSHTLRKVFLVERNRARVAVVHLPADWLAAAPLWTLLRHAMLAAAGLGGRGLAAGLPAGRRALLPFVVAAAHGAGWLRLPGSLRRRAALARRVRAEGGLDAGRWRERLAEARAGPRELMRRGRI
jgi:GT2 family glycosyltransferase